VLIVVNTPNQRLRRIFRSLQWRISRPNWR